MSSSHTGPTVELRGIGKRFGGVTALTDVSGTIAAGSLHALVGENGAGKSTLGKLLAGLHRPDSGAVLLDGTAVHFRSPAEARAAGVVMVPQELLACPDLSVAESVALGRWPRRGPGGFAVNRRALAEEARTQLAALGVELPLSAPMRSLSVAQIQLVQIAAALGSGARLLIFDEPTAALSAREAERLALLLLRLRADGRTLVLVSHRLPEVLRLADAATVLRDGRVVATLPRAELSAERLVRAMVGRDLAATPVRAAAVPRTTDSATPRLQVTDLSVPGRVHEVSLSVQAGEIVGLAGLVGAGRSELLRALCGLQPGRRGRVRVDGHELPADSPRAARRARLALVPEDRQREGLVMGQGARFNWSLPRWSAWTRRGTRLFGGGLLADSRERGDAVAALARADVRVADCDAPVVRLSGGNQQKLLLARWLDTGAGVLVVDEPTRGVDVAAKAEIHALLAARAAQGAALLVASSELPELLSLCDRILVLREGRLVAELPRAQADEEVLLRAMTGAADMPTGVHP